MNRVALSLALLLPIGPSLHAQSALPAWRQSGVCYEIFVRSFHDSDGDGIGDLRGVIAKLDHVNDGNADTDGDLGATCIWLMPVTQSPSYHGYDVTNYYQVNRDYGTNADFRELIEQAHRRGIRVIIDLVINHMSAEHPFFRSALLDAGSPYRDWFIWSPAPRPSPGWEAPVWHDVPTRDEYYYGLFWSGMPDYNLAHPPATAELRNVARFWLEEMGADGFRMDAVGHLFEGPGGQWKHGPGVHTWLSEYGSYIRSVAPESFTIGEVWDSTGAIEPYYPGQLDSYFVFEVADALLDAVRTGSGADLVRAVSRAQERLPRGRWSPFLRNHDQRRTMAELGGDVARARLAATLLLTLPGFPFIYYGEEIGMTGDKPDPRLRTPMHWTRERAAGFTAGTPWEPLQPDSFSANVAVQSADTASLLHHYRRVIRLRAGARALAATADFIPLDTGSEAVIAWLRRDGDRVALVVANLGTEVVAGVSLSSPDAVLPPGRYRVRPLLGRAQATFLDVRRDGRIQRWIGMPWLEPLAGYVLELSPH
ncbi:MAG TPA: alpha-amylase family glycosyl hydrolase [Longimicrobiales bacterium]